MAPLSLSGRCGTPCAFDVFLHHGDRTLGRFTPSKYGRRSRSGSGHRSAARSGICDRRWERIRCRPAANTRSVPGRRTAGMTPAPARPASRSPASSLRRPSASDSTPVFACEAQALQPGPPRGLSVLLRRTSPARFPSSAQNVIIASRGASGGHCVVARRTRGSTGLTRLIPQTSRQKCERSRDPKRATRTR